MHEKSLVYDPSHHGGRDFRLKIPSINTFSSGDYFKTVFTGNEAAEQEARLKKEQDYFEKTMVVDSKVFKVNTMTKKTHLVDKFTSILEDAALKKGLQLTQKQVNVLKDKNIVTTRAVMAMPIS
jgi:hypothetical protein